MKRFGVAMTLGALLVAGLMLTPASAAIPEPAGTWYFRPDQTFTTASVVTQGFNHQAAVRPPINTDGSSNFNAKNGVVPVQFDLLSAPTTTTTTTKTYADPVWKSNATDWPYTFAQLCLKKDLHGVGTCQDAPATPALTFAQITNLSADYLFTTGDCYGGSLRWDVYLENGSLVNVYYGTPNGPDQGCSGLNSGSGQNLIATGVTANRFGFNNGGTYFTYADALAATNGGTDKVVGAQLTLDSGWLSPQEATVSNVTVNTNTWIPKTTETTITTTVDGAYAKTCTLPAAELRWAKNDATATGAVNEAESIQPKDTGQFYRQVDCKYIYNLDVRSLAGKGTYTVWVRINGVNIQTPATFDLK